MSGKPIQKKKAEQVLEAVKDWAVQEHDWQPEWKQPWLAEPGHETSSWAVSWEEGPYDWPFLFSEAAYLHPTLRVPGTFIEPVNGFALGVYRP